MRRVPVARISSECRDRPGRASRKPCVTRPDSGLNEAPLDQRPFRQSDASTSHAEGRFLASTRREGRDSPGSSYRMRAGPDGVSVDRCQACPEILR